MIYLHEVAKKLEAILNGTDTEVHELISDYVPQFAYVVETSGFHLDHIYVKKQGKNFIPVFISTLGGAFNPVPELQQANYSLPINFYFPVRFKDDLFALANFLAEVFVGRYLNYGDLSGKAISNISVPQYGEIQNLDLNEFKKWVNEKYKETIEVMEPYLSMQITLYLTSSSADFVYGNDVTATLEIVNPDSETEIGEESLVFVSTSIQSQSQGNAQQELGTNEAFGVPFGTSYGSGFTVYYKDNNFFNYIVKKWFEGESQELRFNLTVTLGDNSFSRFVYLNSVNFTITKGQLITLTFGFSPAIEDDEEEVE